MLRHENRSKLIVAKISSFNPVAFIDEKVSELAAYLTGEATSAYAPVA